MSHFIPPASVGPGSQATQIAAKDESVRILAIRQAELACYARHLDRQRRRQQELAEHLQYARKQAEISLQRSRQQVAAGQTNERIAELEKALNQAKSEVTRLSSEKRATTAGEPGQALADARAAIEVLRRAEARLANEKSGLEATVAKLPALEKALAQARSEVEAQRRDAARLAAEKLKLEQSAVPAAKLAEVEQALEQARRELESQRPEVARLTADKANLEKSAAELQQALTQARKQVEESRQSTKPENPESSARLAELEMLLTEAANELEARERELAALRAAQAPPAPAKPSPEVLLQLRQQIEAGHEAELARLQLDLDALRQGNAKLRQDLQAAQAKAVTQPPTDVESTKKENDALKARTKTLEADVQQLVKENEQQRGAIRELEEERKNLERETAQFDQQRNVLEEEIEALRKKLENAEAAQAGSGKPASPDPLIAEMMAGDIVPEPDSDEVDVATAAEPPQQPVTPIDLKDGFEFARRDTELSAMQRLFEADHQALEQELSDPQAQPAQRPAVDFAQQKQAIDQLLTEVRKARIALTGKPSRPAVRVAAPQPAQPKPRSTFQGLRRWLRGRD